MIKTAKQRNIKTIPQYNFDQYRLDLAYLNNNKKIDIEVDGVTYHTDWTGERNVFAHAS